MAVIFSILALLLTLADAYIAQTALGSISWFVKGWLFLPALIYWALILWMFFTGDTRQMILNGVMWITICIVLPTFVFTVFSLVGKGLGLLWSPLYPALSWTGAGIAAVWFAIALYGSVIGWRRLEVKNTDITLPDLPENFNGYRIVQLTDFHIGVYGSTPGAVRKIVDRVNSLHPDIIVFTGDLVNTSPEELPQFTQMLSALKAPDGVISVLGNHDYCIYHRYDGNDTPDRALARVVKTEEAMGWNLLRNRAVQIRRGNDSIAIVGVENAGSAHFPDKSDLKKALKDVPQNECKILLSHDPSHWRREVLPDTDIPLMLAGHTHAMQFRLGNFSPSEWTYPEWGGLYREGNQQLYVSTGVGGNIAFRFGVYPTIDVLTLHCGEPQIRKAH
ncbi:MAG: metallophosphoesterase [Bacteroides sp.]|nr:metallophosphoesterase [Bacteroides sp.]